MAIEQVYSAPLMFEVRVPEHCSPGSDDADRHLFDGIAAITKEHPGAALQFVPLRFDQLAEPWEQKSALTALLVVVS